jgi:hypothetical protein
MQIIPLESTGAPDGTGNAEADFPLGIDNFNYRDLYEPERLRQLAETFYAQVRRDDAGLHADLMAYLDARGANLKGTKAESELLIAAAPHLSRFIARLFAVEGERAEHMRRIKSQDAVFQFKNFITRRALKRVPPEQALAVDLDATHDALTILRRAVFADTLETDDELGTARLTIRLLGWEERLRRARDINEPDADEELREIREARERVEETEAAAALKKFESEATGMMRRMRMRRL